MGVLNFFKKKNSQNSGVDYSEMLDRIDTSGMSKKQKLALLLFKKMPKKKQEEMMRKAMNPQNIQKEKEKALKQIDEMVKRGEIDKGQAEAVKSQMGLR